ncbi:E3 ubiquitin-protein ligase TRIM11-like [Lacerta agilis]|uniref:E3 ubiquitin-protein ligase TRIM11-like n=1 Tax=Lacerta agilis TaxID=80427 RepID=UPI001419AF97|nr:E3 ubiquitin-protein ligase TRIM11-like [Lacerta agilis]
MAAEDTLKTFEVEVTCSICLEYFTDPVILDCGHNFCHHCVFKYWKDFVRDRSCPECRTVVEPDRIITNKPLENLAGFLRDRAKQAKGGERTCYRHPEPPTSFCKTDQALVCSACAESAEHMTHDLIPKEQAAQETKDRVVNCISALENREDTILQCRSAAENQTQTLIFPCSLSIGLLKKLLDKLMQETQSKFNDLRQFLLSEEHTLVGKLRDILKEIVTRRDNHMTKLFREVCSCEILIRELEKKCSQSESELLQDAGSSMEKFHQETPFQCASPFSPKQLWEIWDVTDANISLESAMKEFKDALESRSSLQEAIVAFDPETAHPRLVLSEDSKSVRLGDRPQELPKSRKRFEANLFLLGCEEFAVGRNYWDVAVGSEGEWAVGVARKSVKRKDVAAISYKVGIWAIGKRGSQYAVFNPPDFPPLSSVRELKKVRVSLNCDGRHVAFFDGDDAALLFQTPITTVARESFLPFFHVSNKAVLTLPR